MTSAQDVAKYFLKLAHEDEDELISNLKLQKLLYYAQGFHLAMYNKPLFPEEIKAWVHGPVVPPIYGIYKKNGSNGIPYNNDLDLSRFDEDAVTILDEVYKVYGQFTAGALRNMTHSEPPWSETPKDETISHRALKAFFLTRLVD